MGGSDNVKRTQLARRCVTISTGKLGFHLSPHEIPRDQKSCEGIRFDVSQDGGEADLNLGRMHTTVKSNDAIFSPERPENVKRMIGWDRWNAVRIVPREHVDVERGQLGGMKTSYVRRVYLYLSPRLDQGRCS